MKETIITGKRKILELCILACCFIAAFSFNVYSITNLNASWSELFTMFPMVLMLTVGLYVAIIVIRLIIKSIIFLLFFPFRDKKGVNEGQNS